VIAALGRWNALAWAFVGWLVAVCANAVSHELSQHWMIAAHSDEVIIGVLFGFMRWVHGEWRVERTHASQKIEAKVRDALVILGNPDHSRPEQRAEAVNLVVEALAEHRPVHDRFLPPRAMR